MRNEFELIQRLTGRIPRKLQGLIGIGDDAGVFPIRKRGPELLTADAIVEGVDFILSKSRPESVGHKALAINLSDLAAMGAVPVAFVVTLGIPKNFKEKWLIRFYDGMIRLARRYGVLCVGGDITRAPAFFASISLVGRASSGKLVLRKGAGPGDFIGVTGALGGSILGRHLHFEPRIQEARFLTRFRPTSMIDISDGLAQDLGHILKASRAGARISLDAIPVSAAALKLAKGKQTKALEHALSDGEDFELLLTIPSRRKARLDREWKKAFPRLALTWIGNIQKGSGGIVWFQRGRKLKGFSLKQPGFVHF